jgi:hypothetical protein
MTANDVEGVEDISAGHSIRSDPRRTLSGVSGPVVLILGTADLDLDQGVPRATGPACQGSHGATNALGAIFFLRRRGAARAAVYLGRVLSKTPGRGEGESLYARHSYLFRSEMARTHCLRYQPPDDSSDIDGKYGAHRSGAPNDCRCFCRREKMGRPCDAAAFRRAIAGIRHKIARTKAATPDQNCQEASAGAQDRDGTPAAIWLVWPELLVRAVCLR